MSISYRVETRGNCVFVYGAIPISLMAVLPKMVPENSVTDLHVARLMGATIAAGPKDEIELYAAAPDVLEAARERSRKELGAIEGAWLPDGALEWHAVGHRGSSSNAIFGNLTGTGNGTSVPRDPADLIRCRKLLEQVPALAGRFGEMANVSDDWRAYVDAWDNLCAIMDAECPDWRGGSGRCPKTYEAMKKIGA